MSVLWTEDLATGPLHDAALVQRERVLDDLEEQLAALDVDPTA